MHPSKQPSPSPAPSPAASPAPFSPQPTRVGINVHPVGSPEPQGNMPRVLSSNDLSKISRMVESSSHSNIDIINNTKREPLNIIIPMGGIGARFAEQGYRFPKPLVNVVGRPMLFFILDNLNFQPGDKLWLAVRNTIETQFRLCERVRTEFSSQVEVSPVILEFDTRGAAETLTVVLQSMSDEELSRKTISLDCDTVYFSDVLGSFRNLPPNVNATYYFEDQGTAPIYSYVRLVKDSGAEQKSPHGTVLHPDQVVEVKEKVAISCHANTGAYAFASAALLRDYCFKLLHQGVGKEGEYYTSRVIALMLQNNEVFHGLLMPSFACLGTPRQLKEFFESVAHGKVQFKRKVRVCFDLDSTLVTNPTVPGDYTTCRPIDHNIRLAQALHKAGHVIIIHTARRMKTCKGNVGAVVKNVGMVTLKQLDDLQIPYDEIYFGKPYADLYVDDLSVNALLDTEKELGWLEDERRAAIQQKHQLQMVNARSFNHLQIQGGIVRKTSSFEAIDGEAFYYQHLPQDVGRLFPKVIDLIHTPANETTPATTTLVLEQIIGVPFSLLICNYCVDPDRLVVLLTALKSLHSSSSAAEFAKTQGPVPLYANYGPKIQSRYKANQAFYEGLTLDGTDSKLAERCLKQLMEKSEDYEKNKRAICVPAIHGDPVFSNALLTNNEEIKFLDMRGKLGNMLTLQGDVHYDLAKVYQSLCGYDIIMHGYEVMCAPRQRFLRNLRQVFAKFVEKNYPQVRMSDVEWICASLWFSLLPLHLPTASDEVSRDVQEGKLREYFRQACILLGVHQPSI